MVTIDTMRKKAKIDYPVLWNYKVIIDSKKDINDEIKSVISGFKSKITDSKTSNGGKYKSYNIKIMVNSEEERLDIFMKLKKIAKFVL